MKAESIRFKKRAQVTIPKEFVDQLNLQEGDRLECRLEDGKITIVPTIEIPKDQAWFWTEEWQEGEKEASKDISAGRYGEALTTAEDIAEYFASLDEETE